MTTATGRISQRKNNTAGSTLPEIGKIKTGEKRLSSKGVEYPVSLDYFRATGNFAGEFRNVYGEKPIKLSIAFVSNDLSEVCNERYEAWVKGKCWGRGDGSTFSVWDQDQKKYLDGLPANDPRVTSLKWEVMLTLRFVLLEMKGILGYWAYTSKGKASTIPSVVKAFDFVRERAGTIAGFPFTLMVEKKTGYNPGDPKSYPVVTLVPNFSETAIEQVAAYIETGGSMNKITTNFIKAKESLEVAPHEEVKQIDAPKVEMTGELFPDVEGGQA